MLLIHATFDKFPTNNSQCTTHIYITTLNRRNNLLSAAASAARGSTAGGASSSGAAPSDDEMFSGLLGESKLYWSAMVDSCSAMRSNNSSFSLSVRSLKGLLVLLVKVLLNFG